MIEADPVRASAWKEKANNNMTARVKRGFLPNERFTNEISSHETFLSASATTIDLFIPFLFASGQSAGISSGGS